MAEGTTDLTRIASRTFDSDAYFSSLDARTTPEVSQKGNGLPMVGTQQARFLVLVTDWTEVAPNYFEKSVFCRT